MAAVTKAFLEKAYLAYFGRPVDPNGALFWLQPGTTEADVVNGFSNSAESIALYGAPTVDSGAVITQVNAIYNVLFGRDGDVNGVTWWANQIITGKVVAAAAAVEILNGAQGSDKIIVENKLLASAAFTTGLDTIEEINGYTGDAATAVAREWLATVTTTPATQAQVNEAIADSVAASAPPPPLTLAVDSPSVVEGNSGLQQLVFTLTLSAAQTTDTVVNFQTLNTGTATAGSDFNAAAGAVTFVAGQTTATVTVEVKGDTDYESNETVKVQFSSVALATPVTATGTIINDDILPPPPPTLAVDSPSVVEGNSGLQQLVFTLTLSAAQTTDTVVNFETLDTGTATAGVDFNPAAGAVVFVAGQTTATVTVAVKGDTVHEPNETVKVQFSGVALANSVTATGTIINDDILPQTFILTSDLDVFNGGEGNDTFLATQDTLQLGDVLNGGGGQKDELNLSISGHNGLNTGFSATDIEIIQVKSLAHHGSTLDMSDVSGVTLIESNESSGALSFVDIQSVNSVDISITDTSATHNFSYDTNAYTAGVDTVELTLAEITGAQINFDGGSSDVDQIDIDSQDNPNPAAGDTDATINTVSDLNVGDMLATVNITGNADLIVGAPLDVNVELVNAETLDGNLTLDLSNSNDGAVGQDDGVEEIVYIGAMQNDHVDFGTTNNAKDVTLGEGDDWVRTGAGVAFVDGGNGNDTIITGALNDLVIGGEGNDVVTDAGADNHTTGVTTRYVAGGNEFDLGLGDDELTVTGGGNNTAELGDGDDKMLVGADGNSGIVTGNQNVTAGTGNDHVDLYANGTANVDLGAGADFLYIERNATANSTVTAGEGDDTVTVDSSGNVNGTGDGGDDTFTINGNGGHTIDMGDGDDSLAINGNGTHNLTLGSGDDTLTIVGSRNTAGNADNGATDGYTVIDAGDGNDTVSISAEHFLKADLGTGDDHLSLRAKDLSADDIVAGGAGNDTLTLTNETQRVQDGRVLASETSRTTGFETYDLWNSNITLTVTDEMIETAEDMDFTVSTLNSNQTPLPSLTWYYGATVSPFSQGMTYDQYSDYSWYFSNGYFYESDDFGYSLANYFDYYNITVDFADSNGDGDTDDIAYYDGNDDHVFFQTEVGTQTVDITSITTPDYAFTLTGGSVQDIVIADDDSINGRMTLDFNGSSTIALSFEDTLRVVGEAEITAADLRNVSGLERIELSAGNSSQAVTWGVELTDRVINQTTGSATLVISVDANTPAGSVLYITLDPSIDAANNNVVIEKNSNVTVYINDVLVTEPMLGYDFNPDSPYTIKVVNQLNFTANADNLVGGEDDDIFHAASLAVIQAGDTADGQGGFDTLDLQFAVNDASSTLDTILGANLQNIERIEFNTGNNVEFGGIGLFYAPDLEELATGDGDDTLTLMRQGLSYELNAGDDSISLLAFGAGEDTTVDGGAGVDSVFGSSSSDVVSIRDVEYVDGGAGNDRVDMLNANDVTFWNVEHIEGSYDMSTPADGITADGSANIYVDGNWGNDTINVGLHSNVTNATVNGGDEADLINVHVSGNASVQGDDGNIWDKNDTITVYAPNATVYGQGGADGITVRANTTATVDGGSGNDTIDVRGESTTWTVGASVAGGSGDDSITVYRPDHATVTGGDGNDTIDVNWSKFDTNIDGGNGNDSITTATSYNATVVGGSGNDTISATDIWITGTVDGGSGDDSITVSSHDNATTITVTAGDGNDTVNVSGSGSTTIDSGFGDDTIHLQVSTTSGAETIVFGNITYDGLQNQVLPSQGTDVITGFNWEASGPTAGAEDILNFSAFNGAFVNVQYDGALDGGENGGQVNVVSTTNNGFILTNANWASTGYSIADNGEGVLIIGKDTDAQDGFDHFDVYYVQDVDSSLGLDSIAVKVNLVGTIDSATNVGLTSLNAANFA